MLISTVAPVRRGAVGSATGDFRRAGRERLRRNADTRFDGSPWTGRHVGGRVISSDARGRASREPALRMWRRGVPRRGGAPPPGEGVGWYAGFCSRRASRRALDGHLSRSRVATTLQRSTRGPDEQPHRPLSDLAPGEVYRADRIAPAPGGLLHHRFTLTADRSLRRSVLCGTVSRVTPGGCYPPPCSAEPGRSSAPELSLR